MSVKLILTDLDGTLLSSGQVAISERNMNALKKAHEQGILIVPCTGRVVDMLPPELLSCDFIRYVLASHGARVYDRKTGRTLYEDTLTPEQSYQVLKIFENKGIYAEIAAQNHIYVEQAVADNLMDYAVPYHHYWFMRDYRFLAAENIAQYFLDNGIRIEKVNIYGIPAELQQSIFDELSALGFLRFTKPHAGADLEFYHDSLDKIEALDTLLRELNIDKEDAFAIGDSMTDYAVLNHIGTSIAMGNGIEAVKNVAIYITDSNVEDGAAKAIQKYALSGEITELPSLQSFTPSCQYLVCIDSDGCAMDTMEIKHKECFCTALIEVFGLQSIAKFAREAWDYTNLYSKTRGFYRMKTLILTMELLAKRREVIERGFQIPDMTPLKEWCEAVPVLSDKTLAEYAKEHPSPLLDTVLEWSAEVNRRVKRIVHDVPPFPFVKESLAKLAGKADVVVVSATPTAALEKEWTEHGLKQYTAMICGQEYGSKKDVLAALRAGYASANALMMGDALGDYQAAMGAGVGFYPICPNTEDASWKEFHDTVADIFLRGEYCSDVEKAYAAKLDACLSDTPAWDH